MNEALKSDVSDEVIFNNTLSQYMFKYDVQMKYNGNDVYVSSNQGKVNTISYFAITVSGSGTIIFDYKISSYQHDVYNGTKDDKFGQGYGIYTTVEPNYDYGHQAFSYSFNFLSPNGENNVTYANGDTGWRTGEILVDGSSETTTIYIAYVKQAEMTALSPEQHLEDSMYISNVRFVTGNSNVKYEISRLKMVA